MTTVSIPTSTVAVADSGVDVALTIGAATTTVTATGGAGPANSLAIGSVTAGTAAAATITGTPPSQTLDLTLPGAAWGNITGTLADQTDLDSALAGKVATTDLPYQVVFPCANTGVARSGTWFAGYLASSMFNVQCYNTSGADGNYVEFSFFAAAGTYTLRTVYRTGGNGGIAAISIDGGAALGTTIDMYAASAASNNVSDITGVTVATSGRHTIRYTVSGKNASSSGFLIIFHGFTLTRTGA